MQMIKKFRIFTLLLLGITSSVISKPQIGQSAIGTLVFPWGTRSLGMAETFTGIADNSEAIFYNPAGLGQTPLSKSWIHSFNNGADTLRFTDISAKPNREISDEEIVWALQDNGTINKFNGASWTNFTMHLLDSGQTIREVAEQYLDVKEYADIDSAIIILKKFNGIGEKYAESISELLAPHISNEQSRDSLSSLLAYLPVSEQDETSVLGYIFELIATDDANEIASKISGILNTPSEFSKMLELKIPFSIAVSKGINHIAVDFTGRLWVSTDKGIWRFDGMWKQFTTTDGMPSDTANIIVPVSETEIYVGTSKGFARFSNGVFTPILPNVVVVGVNDIAIFNESTIFLATTDGLYKIADETKATKIVKGFSNITGNPTALMTDSRGRLWVGGENGMSIFDGSKWKQYKFEGSVVNQFAEADPNHFWVATSNAGVEMLEAQDGSIEWKFHHDKNDLSSSEVNSVVQFGDDAWLATGRGVSQLKNGEVHATVFFEKLLPSLKIDDIWHAAMAGVVPIGEAGTIGMHLNYLYFGEVPTGESVDGKGTETESAYELVGGISYGLPLKPDFSVGLSLKYAYSRLTDDAKAHSVSVDAALLKKNLFTPNLSLGFSMLNMGPAVYYDDQNSKDPIPFTLRYGMAYKPVKTPAIELQVAFDLEREIVYIDEDDKPVPFFQAIWYDLFKDSRESAKDEFQKVILHTGFELTYAQLISGRMGYMHDKAGERREMTFGMGLKTNILLADFGMIIALGENDIRSNQVRFSLTYAR